MLTVVNSIWVLSLLFFVAASSLLASTRSMLAWSLDGMAPKWFSAVSARFHTPTWSLLLCATIAEIWVLLYAFTSEILVLGGFLGQCIPFAGVCLAALVFPFRRRREFESSPIAYRWGRVPVISVLGAVAFACVGYTFYRLLVDARLRRQQPPVGGHDHRGRGLRRDLVPGLARLPVEAQEST